MGANFDYRTYDGKLTQTQAQDKFYYDRDVSQSESGSSYSGVIGMLLGPVEFKNRTFGTVDEAVEWLGDNQQKWGPAFAVKARDVQTVPFKFPTYGGRTSGWQDPKQQPYITHHYGEPADGLTADEKVIVAGLLQRVKARDGERRTGRVEFDALVARLTDLTTPFKEFTDLRKLRGEVAKLDKAAREALADLNAFESKHKDKLYQTKVEDRGEVWVIGGNCAS